MQTILRFMPSCFERSEWDWVHGPPVVTSSSLYWFPLLAAFVLHSFPYFSISWYYFPKETISSRILLFSTHKTPTFYHLFKPHTWHLYLRNLFLKFIFFSLPSPLKIGSKYCLSQTQIIRV